MCLAMSCVPPPPLCRRLRRTNTAQAQLLISLVPYCRSEPDGTKCRELYELLSDFLSKGSVDACSLCAALPALLPTPPTAAAAVAAADDANSPHATGGTATATGRGSSSSGSAGVHADLDGPLPGPAPPAERELTSTAVEALSAAVAADGVPGLVHVVPLLVWLMRLIVEPRLTPADGHLTGLLGLARIIIGWLGPHGKEAVGLWGLEGITVGGDGVGDCEGGGGGGGERTKGLLLHVYHECLFDIATHENHGPLAPPKCR